MPFGPGAAPLWAALGVEFLRTTLPVWRCDVPIALPEVACPEVECPLVECLPIASECSAESASEPLLVLTRRLSDCEAVIAETPGPEVQTLWARAPWPGAVASCVGGLVSQIVSCCCRRRDGRTYAPGRRGRGLVA